MTNTWDEARFKVRELKINGKTVVFTNGCFDIIHPGHVRVLKEARELGDFLIVGLNSDDSIKRLKGESRPVNPLEARAEVLSAIRFVDMVVPFEEDTPYELIEYIRPHILVKGGDYKPENVIGADLVDRVETIPLVKDFSTTKIIDRLSDQ